MTDFVTIWPALQADKTPRRIPMPGGLGLPTGKPLPATGARVPLTEFVQRLIADKDVETKAPAPPAPAPAPPVPDGDAEQPHTEETAA